jgi:acyl-CoA thioesterase-1
MLIFDLNKGYLLLLNIELKQLIRQMKAIKLRYYYIALTLFTGLLASCGNNKQPDTAAKQPDSSVSGTETRLEKSVVSKNILFFGTSLTAGLGVDPEEAFPAVVQHKIDSLKLPYKVINAGLSGETSAAGKNRIDWLLRQPVDIFVLELGANDGLRGIAVKETEANLQAVIDKVKKKYPKAKMILAGMQMPPSMGEKYTVPFRDLFPALAKKNNMDLIPFLLQGVGGIPRLIQQDGLHPTPEGHKILAQNVWKVLQPDL